MKETVEIQKNRISYLTKAIEKLNKKARKLGCPEMVLTISPEERVVEITSPETGCFERVEVHVEATLDYEIPIIKGYELICTFDIEEIPGEDAIVLTSKVPDKVIPVEYLNKTEIHCEHCGLNRRRYHSMLMRNVETGEHIEVGSTCIKDFFGHNPRGFLWMAQIDFRDIIAGVERENFGDGFHDNYAYGLHSFLAMTNACIRNFGWTSRGVAYDTDKASTSDDVMSQFSLRLKGETNYCIEVKDDDKKMADDTINHFLNIEPEDNDYLTNCKKVAELGYVPVKMIGVACSMIVAYKRSYEEERKKLERGISEYVGSVGEKIEVPVECVFETDVESMYGVSVLYIFVDKDGNKFKTFYSGHAWECEQGDEVILKGTIKKHEEYKGEKATMLTRCKVV